MASLTLRDARDISLVAAGCAAAAVVVPALPFVGVPLAALGLSWLVYRFGVAYGVVGALAATTVGALLTGPATAILTGPALLVAGPVTAVALRRRPAWTMVGAVTLVTFAGSLAAIEVDAAFHGSSLIAVVRQDSDQLAASLRTLVAQSGGPNAAALRDQVEAVRLAVFQTWPSAYFVTSALVGLLAVVAVLWVARRVGVEANRLPPFDRLDVSWHWVWPVAVGLGCLAIARFLNQSSSPIGVVGDNILIVTRYVLFAQGLAVFSGLYRRAGIGRVGRTLGFVLLFITEALTPLLPLGLVSLTGLVDLFVNVRKLPRHGSTPPADALEGTGGTE